MESKCPAIPRVEMSQVYSFRVFERNEIAASSGAEVLSSSDLLCQAALKRQFLL